MALLVPPPDTRKTHEISGTANAQSGNKVVLELGVTTRGSEALRRLTEGGRGQW